jgi:hypothetical protein
VARHLRGVNQELTLASGYRATGDCEVGYRFLGGFVEQHRSWFALVAFCATTGLVAALGTAILIASASVAFALSH